MKQPPMVIPPAQAEALYDAALADEKKGGRSRQLNTQKSVDDWDDREASEDDSYRLTSFRTTAFSSIKPTFIPPR